MRAWVEQVMGLPFSVHLRGVDLRSRDVEQWVAATYDELRAIEALFSTHRGASEVTRLRRGELALAQAHPLVREVADLCAQARERTGGRFDADLPDGDGTLRWDPSGLVKGWAAERAARRLAGIAGHDVSVNAGGDIAVVPGAGDARPWRIGVEDPDDAGRVSTVVRLTDGGIATSGTATRGLHVRDPRSGRPAAAVRAVTVTGPSLMWADVYATAAMVEGRSAEAWLATVPDYQAVAVTLAAA